MVWKHLETPGTEPCLVHFRAIWVFKSHEGSAISLHLGLGQACH